jgi:hypothetical protein
MPILTVFVVIIVAGVLLWLANQFVPMAPPIKTLLNAVVVIALVLWLLWAFGVLGPLESVRLPRVHR